MAGRSAFVIDDSKSARFALRRYLESMHYVVETAESAEIAFTYLKDHHPDVIFLDHVMPGVDGFDVLNSIKSDPKTIDIPVVICSSNEGEAFTQEARFKGAADVITKPPTPQQLARVLSSLTAAAARAPATGAPAKPATPAAATVAPATPAAAPATAHSTAPAAAPAPKPSEFGMLDRVVAMLDENRKQGLKAIEDLTRQIAELKALVSQLQGGGETRGALKKFRARVLHAKPRALRGSARRKLPRR